jgi:hypothetical protein
MMDHRLDELALRRKRLLLKSARLRADFAADQRYVLQTISGVDKYYAIARGLARPVLFGGLGLLLVKVLSRGRRAAGAGFAMRALMWVSVAKRLLPLVGIARAFVRSRSRPPPEPDTL